MKKENVTNNGLGRPSVPALTREEAALQIQALVDTAWNGYDQCCATPLLLVMASAERHQPGIMHMGVAGPATTDAAVLVATIEEVYRNRFDLARSILGVTDQAERAELEAREDRAGRLEQQLDGIRMSVNTNGATLGLVMLYKDGQAMSISSREISPEEHVKALRAVADGIEARTREASAASPDRDASIYSAREEMQG